MNRTDEDLTPLLADYHESLLADPAPSPEGKSAEVDPRLGRAHSCLRALERLRRLCLRGPDCPDRFGRFEVLGELGRGGQGVVYKAWDSDLRRPVALKVPRPEALTGEPRWRFLEEARTVARLSHPNLLPVYEVGEVGPACYLATQYCPGPTLAAWLKGQSGPVAPAPAARLVATLAETVAFVHGHGILHRDIKPANVLLEPLAPDAAAGRAGPDALPFVPKLCDFGLVRQLGADDGPTRTGAVLGTPQYMAPEQAESRQHEVGPHTDVYALGVILYELLTGRPPFRGKSDLETLNQVVSREAVSPRAVRADVPRDLETVCLKAMAKEPGRRYHSAADLADDLHRFLSGRPVVARPVGRLERLWRWCRREPLTAALLAALLVALVVGMAGITWQWQQARLGHRRAEAAFRQAHQALHEFQDALFEGDKYDGPQFQPLRNDLLQTSLKYYRTLLEQHGDDLALRADIADVFYHLAFHSADVGDCAEAIRLYQESQPLWEALTHEQPDVSDHWYFLAKTHANLSMLYDQIGRPDDALAAQRSALAIREELVGRYPGEPKFEGELAYSCHSLGWLRGKAGRLDEALGLLERARGLRERLVRLDPDSAELRLRLGGTWYELAQAQNRRGRAAEALTSCQEAIRLLEELVRRGRRQPESTQFLVWSQSLLGQLLQKERREDESVRAHARACEAAEQLYRRKPENPKYRDVLATVYTGAADAHADFRRWAESFSLRRRAIELGEKALQGAPDNHRQRNRLAGNYWQLGFGLEGLGRLDEALSAYAQAREHRRRLAERFPRAAHGRLLTQYDAHLARLRGRLASKGGPKKGTD